MPKTSLPSVSQLRADFPAFTFAPAKEFYWSAQKQTIFYKSKSVTTQRGLFQLLHELGHALLGHKNFESGVELLRLEAAAWKKAQQLAEQYNLTLDETQIEHCLDSYRDWLHLRSTCPSCSNVSTEIKADHYRCFNCRQAWKVPSDQRSRHYRLKLV